VIPCPQRPAGEFFKTCLGANSRLGSG
jgi:hypothetical protein